MQDAASIGVLQNFKYFMCLYIAYIVKEKIILHTLSLERQECSTWKKPSFTGHNPTEVGVF